MYTNHPKSSRHQIGSVKSFSISFSIICLTVKEMINLPNNDLMFTKAFLTLLFPVRMGFLKTITQPLAN